MSILKLTQIFIAANLVCEAGKKKTEYCDSEVPGLYALVTATSAGRGTYFLRYKDATGKTCHKKIGKTDDVSLADARKEAKRLKLEISQGASPAAAAKAHREVPTLADFVKDHYLPHAKTFKRSWKRDEELFRLRILPTFGACKLNQLTRKAAQDFHLALPAQGLSKTTADHHIKVLRRALNLAVGWGFIEKNPIVGVQQYNEDTRIERYMNDDELERLLTVLRSDGNRTVCLIVMFLLSTGCRRNEALQATWRNVDRGQRVWRIPATNSKSKRMRSVPLNDSALYVLDQLGTEGEFEHLFVNRQTRLPYTTVMKVWERLRAKADLPELRLHDLRHQAASLMVSNGRTLYEVQAILGHASPTVTQRYSHLSSKTLQEAVNCASVIVKKPALAAAA